MKLWKKLLLYFVSLAGMSFTCLIIVLACGGEVDPYDYYTSFFHSDVQEKKGYDAFNFSYFKFTYTDDEPESEAEINSTEWAAYMGGRVKPGDVKKIMYGIDSAGKGSVLRYLEQDLPAADSLAANSFLRSLKEPAHSAAGKYYQFALQVEKLGQTSYDYWNPEPRDTSGLKDAAGMALQSAISENDQFLKLRYFYQAQKLNHYAGNYEDAKNIYDQHIAKISSKSHVKGWSLALKAGEERRLNDTIRAAYLFSKVFGEYPERRIQAYRNYHYIEAPFSDVLKLAQNEKEKANLYAIKSFANSDIEMESLKQVYDLAPASPMVGVLLVREINKLEQYYLTPSLANNSDEVYSNAPKPQISSPQASSSPAKWLLWAGIGFLLTGAIILWLNHRKWQSKPGGKVAAGLLGLVGIVALGWFTAGYLKKKTVADKPVPEGSFFESIPDSIRSRNEDHIEKLKLFCSNLSNEAKYPEPQLGTLVNAYLCFMQNKPDEGLSALANLDGKTLSGKMADQKQVVNLLLSAQMLKKVQNVDETALLPSLQWLDEKADKGRKHPASSYPEKPEQYNWFAITARNFYTYVLSPAYLRQGDTTKAALALLKAKNGDAPDYSGYMDKQLPDFWFKYLHPEHLSQIIGWKKKAQPDAYLAFLTTGLRDINADKLYELLGTSLLREHRYSEAATAFQQIADRKLRSAPYNGKSYYDDKNMQGDPFYASVNDYPKNYSGKSYTKLTFAEKMAALENQLKKEPQNADVLFQLATGLYSTSMHGNSWGLISYSWSVYDFGRKAMYYYDGDYVKASLAKQYYLKARELSSDPEFKARCTFMAAKCEQKGKEAPSLTDVDYDTYDKQWKVFMAGLKQNVYFNEMQQYKNTAFYRKAINECSYLSDFIGKNNR